MRTLKPEVFSPDEAIQRLAEEIEKSAEYDVHEAYYEIFPDERATKTAECRAIDELKTTILNYLRREALPEELVALLNVVYPEYRQVWYDEEDDRLHCELDPVDDSYDSEFR